VRRLSAITFLAPDYDEAIDWFRHALGFTLIEDTPLEGGKRWVVMAPEVGNGARLVIAKPASELQRARVGDAVGGRVGYFLETDDFARNHASMVARGVRFLESPREMEYGTVAVFVDPWGGKWDLIQVRTRRLADNAPP